MNTEHKLSIRFLSQNEVGAIPKLVEVKNHDFEVVYSKWIETGEQDIPLPPGVYIATAHLSSGEPVKKPVDLTKGDDNIVFDLEKLSRHESQEWAYVSQTLDPLASEDLYSEKYSGAWLRLWKKEGDAWVIGENPVQENSAWNADGVSYEMRVSRNLQALQVGGDHIAWKCIMIPPGQRLQCLIRPVKDQSDTVHPLEVIITTNDWKAETLLSFLQSGDIDTAKSLLEEYASQLLFQKMVSPTNAAIGGYVLLKVRKEDSMRNWAENLTNWMEWLPDGPIIRAWQLINQGSEDLEEIRRLFIDALRRGIPIYTEGMRLLVQGLKMLHYQNRNDQEVAQAYGKVYQYWEALDPTVSTTTFTGERPDSPDAASKKGVPEDRREMAYIFSVPLSSVLEEGEVKPDTRIELKSDLNEKIEVRISEKGTLIDKKGQEFSSAYEALQTSAKDKKITRIEVRDMDNDESFNRKIQDYRLGRSNKDQNFKK